MGPKTRRVLAVGIVLTALLIVPATFAQPGKSATASVATSANIVAAITINSTTPMSFGDFISGSTGNVVLQTNNSLAALPAGVPAAGGTVQSGGVAFTAGHNKPFSVSAAMSTALTGTLGGTIAVDTFTLTPTGGTCSAGTAPTTCTAGSGAPVGPATAMSLAMGATLHLLGTEVADSYTGTMAVTLAYP